MIAAFHRRSGSSANVAASAPVCASQRCATAFAGSRDVAVADTVGALAGKGVAASVDGHHVIVGTAALLKESGVPIEPVYATDGTTMVVGNAALLKNAANPNAAKLFYHFMFSREAVASQTFGPYRANATA